MAICLRQGGRGGAGRCATGEHALLLGLILLVGCGRGLPESRDGEGGPGRGGPGAADEAPWPSFRGNPAMTGVAASSLPDKLDLLWTFETNDVVTSTAAIVDGTVYVGVDDGRVLAIGLADGKLRWKYQSDDPFEASPCVAAGKVYIGDNDGLFHAIDAATGKGLWTFRAKGQILSSANVAGDWVLFGSYDSHLYCLGCADGKERWRFQTGAQVHCGPALAAGAASIAGCDGMLRLIDVKDGEERSSVKIGSNVAASDARRRRRGEGDTLGDRPKGRRTLLCVAGGDRRASHLRRA